MRLLTRTSLPCILIALLAGNLQAQTPAAKIQDAAWLAGHWQGNALGGFCDEHWSTPMAGAMTGMFRLIKDNKVAFYEFFRIAEENGTLMLRLKHFHPDLKGWEEKDATVDFPLLRITPEELVFDGMTFHRTGSDLINVTVLIGDRQTGNVREVKFAYRRAKD